MLGKYLSLQAGLVYHAFDRAEHVENVAVDPALPLLWALDFNVDPMCSVVAQIDGETVRVVDEIVLSRATTRAACEEFQARFPRHEAGICVYGDASGSAHADHGHLGLPDRFASTSGARVTRMWRTRCRAQIRREGAGRAGEREAAVRVRRDDTWWWTASARS